MKMLTSPGDARIRLTASTTTLVVSVFGLNTSVKVVNGAPVSMIISGEVLESRLSRNPCVYDAFARANLAYMPALAPELSA